jgi:hypothetical protein
MTETVENAIYAWVVAGSGLPGEQVIWDNPNQPRPTAPYIAMRITGYQPIGQDWVNLGDAPADPQPLADITVIARGQRQFTIALRCFAVALTGDNSAGSILSRVLSAMSLPSIREALNAAGLGLSIINPIQIIDGVLGSSTFEPRASVDIRVFVTYEATELGTYIEHADIENQATGEIIEV